MVRHAPLRPLLVKELWEVLSGRALWTMLLLLCPLIGYSFVQAVSLYSEASAAALHAPVLARGLSPLDGVLVPSLGAWYVGITLLFPFVAIRVLSQERHPGRCVSWCSCRIGLRHWCWPSLRPCSPRGCSPASPCGRCWPSGACWVGMSLCRKR